MSMRALLKSTLLSVVIAVLIAMSLTTSAFAQQPPNSPSPTGPFALFADCPLTAPNVYDCFVGSVSGGQLTLGKIAVPLNRTLTLQGGLAREPETEISTLVPAADGNTLSVTPLEVPGGLLHMLGFRSSNVPSRGPLARWSRALNGVTATLELVGTAQVNILNLLLEEGPVLSLPARLRFRNPLLGSQCFIGSAAEPVTLPLTVGATNPPPPNQPIKGAVGQLEFEQEGSILTLTGSEFVNNEFTVPKVHGCGLFGQLDGLLDHGMGLPSPAGSNTAIIDTNITLAAAAAVRKSEQ